MTYEDLNLLVIYPFFRFSHELASQKSLVTNDDIEAFRATLWCDQQEMIGPDSEISKTRLMVCFIFTKPGIIQSVFEIWLCVISLPC